jgi:1,4-dihydroxy-6-naphthoate synthase
MRSEGKPRAPSAGGGTRPALRVGHSPDADDVFMWWPLFESGGEGSAIDTGRFRYLPETQDIEGLNERALRAELEITALSCAHYPFVKDAYALTACGSSLGDACGPRLVAGRPGLQLDDLRGALIAIPGRHTSAFAALRLWMGPRPFRTEVVGFERIIDHVAAGRADAGLVIHEGQLTFGAAGLHLVEDLGRWWSGGPAGQGLPLPLGVNAVRRDLEESFGPGTLSEVTATLRRSVEHAVDHRELSMVHAARAGRGLGAAEVDRFVRMYVNAWSLDFGAVGRAAVGRFLRALHEAGLGPEPGEIDCVCGAPA